MRWLANLCVVTGIMLLYGSSIGARGEQKPVLKALVQDAVLTIQTDQNGTSPTQYHFEVRHRGASRQLHSVNDLNGLVNIRTANEALDFVRLRTSVSTFRFWPDESIELEVTRQSDALAQARYGLRSDDLPTRNWVHRSGMSGVLSDRAFKQGEFSAPVVIREGTGYSITRWIYVIQQNDRQGVQQIRESVTKSGHITRTVLRRLPLPTLPATTWEIERYARYELPVALRHRFRGMDSLSKAWHRSYRSCGRMILPVWLQF